METNNTSRKMYTIYISPGDRLEIHTRNQSGDIVAVNVFRMGQSTSYTAFNSDYKATITGITPKNVTFQTSFGKKRVSVKSFAVINKFFGGTNCFEFITT